MSLSKDEGNRSLEQLENDRWAEDTYGSTLTAKVHALRKKKLKEFTVEDLRIMIGQGVGLNHLIPLALDKLKKNILAEGDYFEGDLLLNVLRTPDDFWAAHPSEKKMLSDLLASNKPVFDDPEKRFDRELLRHVNKFS